MTHSETAPWGSVNARKAALVTVILVTHFDIEKSWSKDVLRQPNVECSDDLPETFLKLQI